MTMISRTDSFGRELAKKDMGDHYWAYEYDAAGRAVLGGRTTGFGGPIDATNRTGTEYYNTGRVKAITTQLTSVESYGYDANGNRVSETGSNAGIAYKTATASYDAMNRMTNWTETENYGNTLLYPYIGRHPIVDFATMFV